MVIHGSWGESPIGAGLTVMDSGQTLTTLGQNSIRRVARSNFPAAAGLHGAEFVFWGEDDQVATLGICTSTASLASELGSAAGGVGWRLHVGEVVSNGAVISTGLPIPQKGEAVGVRLTAGTPSKVEFYRGESLVAAVNFNAGGPYYFAASLASTKARGLSCVVNAGQWQGLSPAVAAGWQGAAMVSEPIRLGSEDFMTRTTDLPSSAPYLGVIDADGFSTVASVSFWMWGNDSRAGSAQLRVHDADGVLDAAALSAIRDVPVSLRRVTQDDALASSLPVARYVLDRVEIEDDASKRLVLKDAHSDLDGTLSQSVFLPPQGESIAWQMHPVVIGLVRSAPGVSINSDGSQMWLADAKLLSILDVRDRAAGLASGSAYTLAESGQQLVLTSPPVGPVTADVSTQAGGMPARLHDAVVDLFGRVGKTSWVADDALAIDAASGYAGIGYYAGEVTTVRTALSGVLATYCADWWQDGDGLLRMTRLVDPDDVSEVQLQFDLDLLELSADLVVMPDLAPNLTRRMNYQPNAAVLAEGDMVTDVVQVPGELRKLLSATHRGQVYGAGLLANRYQHADSAPPVPSLFDRREDAQAEIDRIVSIYATPRNFYAGRMAGRLDVQLRPGQIGRIRYPRYGLAAGRKVIVTGVTYNPVTGEQSLKFWGA